MALWIMLTNVSESRKKHPELDGGIISIISFAWFVCWYCMKWAQWDFFFGCIQRVRKEI